MVFNKLFCPVFFCVLSLLTLYFLHVFFANPFKLETSVWCLTGSNQTKLCKFKNICYDSQFKTLLFFLGKESVIKGFNTYNELQAIQLSSVKQHNQFYANLCVIDVENFKLAKELIVYSKTLLFSRFKPNNIMHTIHDDILPVFLTLESTCLGDVQCMESYGLVFHDNYPKGPFFNLYRSLSKHPLIILNELKANSNSLLCFKEMLTGLILDGVFYQYGFKMSHGPVKTPYLTQNDISRFTSFIKGKLQVQTNVSSISEVVLFNRQKSRKILNIDEVKEMVESVYTRLNKKIKVNVINLDLFSNDLTTLISTIVQADGLIGMHGAEMILSLFLKPNSYVFEIFPFGIHPKVVSFIKPISELSGSNFIYFPWRNMLKNNSVAHPNAHPLFGGISHLDEETQNKIKNTHEVQPFECCNNPLFLYHMYQDTLISTEFIRYLYKSLTKTVNHSTDSKSGHIIKKWYFPHTVFNVSCSFHLHRRILHIKWYPPFNVQNENDLWYSLYIQGQKGLFLKDISTEKTIAEVQVPDGVNPIFEMWISVYFKSNNFKSPDLYLKCY